MALGADDAQAAGSLDLLVQRLPLGTHLLDAQRLLGFRQRLVGADQVDLLVRAAAQHDVGAAARHVGGDGDVARLAGLGDDLGFARVLLGVEHFVLELGLLQQAGQQLGILDAGRTHQHGLAALVAVADVVEDGVVLFLVGLEDLIVLVLADHGLVGRDDDRFEPVDFLEFVRFRVGRAGHAGQLLVHAEVVLEGDRGQRLVLVLDLHAFLGFDGLVQAVRPAAADHQAAGEFVDDDHFAVLDHVLLVAEEQRVGAQRHHQVMHQRDMARIVQRLALGQDAQARQDALGIDVAGFRQVDLLALSSTQ